MDQDRSEHEVMPILPWMSGRHRLGMCQDEACLDALLDFFP
jgi:hypothetical protein